MKEHIRQLMKKNLFLACAGYVADNYLHRIRFSMGNITTKSGRRHKAADLGESLAYIRRIFFSIYKTHAGVEHISGKVAEVGPGDSCGIGLLFLGDGASSVDLVDRFYSLRDLDFQTHLNEALAREYPEVAARRTGTGFRESDFEGLHRYYGANASAEKFFAAHTGYDVIVSSAVMGLTYNPLGAIASMVRALTPGGLMIHQIDLTDHGMCSENFHDLKFLEIPSALYKQMTCYAGRPNRVRFHEYRAELDRLGLRYELLITRLAAVGSLGNAIAFEEIPLELRQRSVTYVRSVRARFCKEYRSATDEDLAVLGCVIIARRPEDTDRKTCCK